MNGKNRTGKFPWEYNMPHHITSVSLRGGDDPRLSSDCRCGIDCENCKWGCCEIKPWIALCSLDSWPEELRTPEGLADGDTIDPSIDTVPFIDRVCCDIYGNIINGLEGPLEEDSDFFEAILLEHEEAEKWEKYLKELKAISCELEAEYSALCPEEVSDLDDDDILSSYEDFEYDPMDDAMNMELLPSNELDGYDYSLDDLPKRSSSAPWIVADRKPPRMEHRSGYWRGRNDCYKNINRAVPCK